MSFRNLYFLGLIISNIFGYSVTFQLYVCDENLNQDVVLQIWDPYQNPIQMYLKDGESNLYIVEIQELDDGSPLSGDIVYNFKIGEEFETSGNRSESILSDSTLEVQYYNNIECAINNLPETINIKFQVNTCQIQERLDSVFVIGNFTNPESTEWVNVWPLKQIAENSDYWILEDSIFVSADLPEQLEYKYMAKYIANDNSTILDWENNLPGNNYQGINHVFSDFEEEAIIPMYYLGTGPEGSPSFESSDEFQDIYFRVNMILQDIDSDYSPSVQLYNITSEATSDGTIVSSNEEIVYSDFLIREGTSSFYSLHYQRPLDLPVDMFYNFGFSDATNTTFNSLETNIRSFVTSGETDTTLAWVYYNDIEPVGCQPLETIEPLIFKINVSNAVSSLGFDEATDFITVRWGYGDTQLIERTDTLVQYSSKRYKAEISTACLDLNKGLYYQYYKNNLDREIFYNFNHNGDDATLAERRFIDVVSIPENGEIFDVEDDIQSARRAPIFKNTNQIGQDITVTYTLDLRPAYYQLLEGDVLEDAQGELSMTLDDDIFSSQYGVWINGDAAGGWNNPNCSIGSGDWGFCLYENEDKKMWDDGSHGDVTPLDSIYTIQIDYVSTNTIGQEFKFGIKGGDNEGGYGNNHIANIDVLNPNIHSVWGSIDPVFYDAWDYDEDMPLSNDKHLVYPEYFKLGKNYPNPFNPTTNFSVFIPELSKVKVSIFDIQGKVIKHLVNQNLSKGVYEFIWDGTNDSQHLVSSGIYFYSLESLGVRLTNKMLYLK